jgi:hypothetical protein
MMAGGAGADDICHKPATRLTIEPDPRLAETLGDARTRWSQLYQLMKG